MILYRATYQADASGHCRRMTFAAPSQTEADRIARDWIIGRELPLTVRAIRPLQQQTPQFQLTAS